MVVTYYIKLFCMADRRNNILMSLLLLVVETIRFYCTCSSDHFQINANLIDENLIDAAVLVVFSITVITQMGTSY